MTIHPLQLSNTFAAGVFTLIRQKTCQIVTLGLLLSALSAAAQPAIGTQPLSRTNNISDNAQFTVAATGSAPLTYQWRINGANISGATTTALNVPVTNISNAGSYSVVVTDGTAVTATSSDAVLSILFVDRFKFTQWNFNSITPDNSVTTGIATPSVGAGTVTVVGTGITANGFNTGSSSDPNTSDNSSRRWNAFASTVANKTGGAKFVVSTAGYQNIAISGELWLAQRSSAYWRGQYSIDGGTNWVDRLVINRRNVSLQGFYYFADDLTGIAGVADNSNFVYQVVGEYESTATGGGSAAYVSVDPGSTFNSSSSLFGWDMVTLFGTAISQQPAIILQPQSHTNYVNTGGGFSVKATGGNLFYQWYFNGSSIDTGTNSDLIIPNVQYTNAGTYRVVVNNTAGSVTSDDAFLTVDSVVLPQGDRFWSADGVTAGVSGGNWDTNTPNRWGTDIGGPFNLQWNNANIDNAIFPAGSGVVTNSSGVAVNKILVTNAVGAAYLFGGTGRISFLGPDSSIYIAGGNTANASNLLSSTCEFTGSVITKSGGGRLHLDNTNSNVGRWVVNQGSLTGSAPLNLFGGQPTQSLSNYITLDGGGLGFIAGAAMSLGTNRGIYLGPGGGQIGNQGTGGIVTIDAPITGPGSLHFPGNTEWPSQLQGDNCIFIISNINNNYQGITRIATSEVRLGANQVFPATTTLMISNLSLNGRLNLNGYNQTVSTVILDSTTGNSRIIDTVGTGSLTAATFDLRRSALTTSPNVAAVLAGPGTLTKTTSGNISLGAANTYSGDTFLQAGTLTLPAAGRFGNGAGTLHLQGATLTIPESRTDATAIINPTSLEAETLIQGTPNATNHILFIHGGTWTMLGGAFYIFNPNTNGFLFQVALTNTFNFSLPIDIGSGCHLISYDPVGSDQIFSGGISGAGVFRRAVSSGDGGRTIFTTDNTYSGGTIVTAGTLLVNNTGSSGSGTGSGGLTVTSVGVLGGNGTISGAVVVTNGGNLLAAAGGGALTLQGGLDLSGSGTNTWELAALQDSSTGTAGTAFGQVVLTAGELQLGGSSVLSLKFSGGTAPDSSVSFWQSTRQWKIINLAGGLNTANASFASIANGSYSAGNFSTAVDGSGNIILTFTASVQSAPGITSHPQSRTNVAGTTASFTVAANGSQPLTYAWFRSTAPFTPISGATNTTLTLTNVQAASAGSYFARAYNGLGNDTSQFALLTVVPSPTIQPLSGAGTSNVVLTWNTVAGNQYQVQFNTNLATANWIPVTTLVGAGGSVSVTNHPPVGDPQRYYRVIIW